MRPAIVALIGLIGVVGALTGCSDELSVQLQLQSNPPIEPALTRDRAVVGEGLAIGVRALPLEDDEPMDGEVGVDLVSSDTGIVDVRPGIEPNTYVLIGRRRGTATIEAVVDGERARPIDVVIEAQAAP